MCKTYQVVSKKLLLPETYFIKGFPGGSAVKNPPANAGDARDVGSIPGLGRIPGEGNCIPLQYFCLSNARDRGACAGCTIHGVTKEADMT